MRTTGGAEPSSCSGPQGRWYGDKAKVDLSRFCAAPRARLGHFPFESDRAFPTQC